MKQLSAYVFLLLLIIGIYVNIVYTTVPFSLTFLLGFAILQRGWGSYFLAFICGILLDSIALRTIGISSIFFLLIISIILLYEHKFEVKNPYFYWIIVFSACSLYTLLFRYQYALIQSLIASMFGFLIFSLLMKKSTLSRKIDH